MSEVATGSEWKKSFLIPLLLLLLTPVATAVGSKLSSGTWLAWFRQIPSWAGPAFGAALIGWGVVLLLVRRRRELQRRNAGFVGILSVPIHGYVTLGEVEYEGVKWRVMLPREGPFSDRPVASEGAVEVDTPPMCPKCGTELEEEERFLGGYRWSCVGCGFATTSKDSQFRQAERVERLIRPQVRADIQKARERGLL